MPRRGDAGEKWESERRRFRLQCRAKGGGIGAAVAEGAEAKGVVTLREADAGFVGHQIAVIEHWRSQIESAIQEELASGRKE